MYRDYGLLKRIFVDPFVKHWLLLSIVVGIPAIFLAAIFGIKDGPKPVQSYGSATLVIHNFDSVYQLNKDGSFDVTEDISFDFGEAHLHGIDRYIPVEDPSVGNYQKRVIKVSRVKVDDGSKNWHWTTNHDGPNLHIRVGDPSKLVTGIQRYRISYRVTGGLNPFADHDELYWNATGSGWPYPIEHASAVVLSPNAGINHVDCYQGVFGSTDPCPHQDSGSIARFDSTTPLGFGTFLTIVVGLDKGTVKVDPPILKPLVESDATKISNFLGLNLGGFVPTAIVALLLFGFIGRQWWLYGRDRWFGDNYYLNESAIERAKSPLGHETVVPELAPPKPPKRDAPLRPAEVGMLLDQRADTLDVSATIVDLAVRGYLRIEQTKDEKGKPDFLLTRLKAPETILLPFEVSLLSALFEMEVPQLQEGPERHTAVRLSELKGVFWAQLGFVKNALTQQLTREDRLFTREPQEDRDNYSAYGIVGLVVTPIAGYLAGLLFGVGLVFVPVLVGSLLLLVGARFMPQRSGIGRELYRRALGFRHFLLTAEADQLRFAEEQSIFDKYLPYAIVFHCAKKWAERFEGLAQVDTSAWFVGAPTSFAAVASDVRGFCFSVDSVMQQEPQLSYSGIAGGAGGYGSSGAGSCGSWAGGFSGFSGGGGGGGGGGFAGGGGGGGGGGAW